MKAVSKSMRKANPKAALRACRKLRVRKKISGASERPRLNVFKSAKHIYVQAIDDAKGVTLAQASTVEPQIRDAAKGKKKCDLATEVGALLGRRLIEKGVKSAVFDRGGFRYGGRVKALADGAREAGLVF